MWKAIIVVLGTLSIVLCVHMWVCVFVYMYVCLHVTVGVCSHWEKFQRKKIQSAKCLLVVIWVFFFMLFFAFQMTHSSSDARKKAVCYCLNIYSKRKPLVVHLQSITRHNQRELIHNFKFNLFGSEFLVDCKTYIKLYLCYYIKASFEWACYAGVVQW